MILFLASNKSQIASFFALYVVRLNTKRTQKYIARKSLRQKIEWHDHHFIYYDK